MQPLSDPERERVAKSEIGHTDVSPVLAWMLVAAFLVVIGVPPLLDVATGRAVHTGVTLGSLAEVGRAARQEGALAGCRALLRQMHQLEESLERRSLLGDTLLPVVQRALVAVGTGNQQVVLGRDRWLYYVPDLDYVAGPPFLDPAAQKRRRRGGREWEAAPQPDPLPALRDFQAQLARRGIALLVVPSPVKPTLEPEPLAPSAVSAAPQNASWPQLLLRLRAAGIAVLDPVAVLAADRRERREPEYLRRDTHWTPQAMGLVAAALAARARQLAELGPADPGAYLREPQPIANAGDLAALLTLPPGHPLKAAERVTIERVQTAEGAPWKADRRAAVLLLGDSFTNIYSQSDLGWGTGAGLAEQLSFYLGLPVDRIAVNSGGAVTTRQRLAQEIANGHDRLAGKKVVVYQFAARELAFGDWQVIDLGAVPPR